MRWLLAASLVLAGCAGSATDDDSGSPEPEDAAPRFDVEGVRVDIANDTAPGAFAARFVGPTDSWAIVYTEWSTPRTMAEIGYMLSFVRPAAAQGPVASLVFGPHLLDSAPATQPESLMERWARVEANEEGREWRSMDAADRMLRPAETTGVAFAVLSTAPWSMELEVRPPDPKSRTHVIAGPGVNLTYQNAEPLAPTAQPGPSVSLVQELAHPGWTHLGLLVDRHQPAGVREYAISFPGGFGLSDRGNSAGLASPSGGCTASSKNIFAGLGAMTDAVGRLEAAVDFHEASTNPSLALLHAAVPPETWPVSTLEAIDYHVNSSCQD